MTADERRYALAFVTYMEYEDDDGKVTESALVTYMDSAAQLDAAQRAFATGTMTHNQAVAFARDSAA